MNLRHELPNLRQFVGCCFHQDAGDSGLEYHEMVDADLAGASPELLDLYLSEIQRALGMLDLNPDALTFEDLGCDMDAKGEGYTVRSFLAMILARADRRRRG